MDTNCSIASFALESPLDRTRPPVCRQLSLLFLAAFVPHYALVQIGFSIDMVVLGGERDPQTGSSDLSLGSDIA
jgi:hypothetical protein